MPLKMRGHHGKLQVGYQIAAQFREWSLTCDRDALDQSVWQLSATVAALDTFWSTQPPTGIRLEMDHRVWWRWHEVEVTSGSIVKGKRVTITFRGNPDIRES
jgi:hypothetical protein